jgi:hypothetical protein
LRPQQARGESQGAAEREKMYVAPHDFSDSVQRQAAPGSWGVRRIIATISPGGRVKLLMIAVLVLVLVARSTRGG